MKLEEFFAGHSLCAIAFSGGTDSSFLLWAASKYCTRFTAYYVQTPFQQQFETEDAKRVAEKLGAKLKIIEYDVLRDENIAQNTPLRCYFCKKKMMQAICAHAESDGYTTVIDGTNATDAADERPGMKALAENAVLSPLRLCGITKEQVRQMSKAAGLFTWEKPSNSCLATRILSGVKIEGETLSRIEAAEDEVRKLGISDFRVRVRHGAALLQVKEKDFDAVVNRKKELVRVLKKYFDAVYLDLEAR